MDYNDYIDKIYIEQADDIVSANCSRRVWGTI